MDQGDAYYGAGDFAKARDEYLKAIYENESNVHYAKSQLGTLYLARDIEVVRSNRTNIEEAFYWTKRAADEDDYWAAQSKLALFYAGLSDFKDIDKAMEYYIKAAAHDEPMPKADLAIIYENGNLVPRNPNKAKELYIEAVKTGLDKEVDTLPNVTVQMYYAFGRCCEEGYGVKINYDRAEFYFSKAKSQSDAEGNIDLMVNAENALNRIRNKRISQRQQIDKQRIEAQSTKAERKKKSKLWLVPVCILAVIFVIVFYMYSLISPHLESLESSNQTTDDTYGSYTNSATDEALSSYTIDAITEEMSTQSDVSDNKVTPEYPGIEIKKGIKSDDVRVIQEYLNTIENVYPSIPQLEVDGSYGGATTAAVVSFQQQFELIDDGVVNEETWNKLIEMYDEVSGE